jgi:hypothetical protein
MKRASETSFGFFQYAKAPSAMRRELYFAPLFVPPF